MSATQTAQLTRTHRVLIGVVIAGAALIAAIGFTGSYAAVRALAEKKGFGAFSVVFPIGIDAGIVVLLALDLLLTWIRIPFPLLRQTAWLLTAATIAFNGAAAWPDALGVGMHAVIPVLFVVAVEAARHAVGRIADLTADRHMEGVRLARWLLAFPSTFRLWRRMKLWELRSYEQVIQLEQDRLVYQARLRARYGRGWRRRAPVESLMPLRLARYGVPLAQTAPAGLAAAGIDLPADRPLSPAPPLPTGPEALPAVPGPRAATAPVPAAPEPTREAEPKPQPQPEPEPEPEPVAEAPAPVPVPVPARVEETPAEAERPLPEPELTVPVGPGRRRPLGTAGAALPHDEPDADIPDAGFPNSGFPNSGFPDADPADDAPRDEKYFAAYRSYVAEKNDFPDSRQFGRYLLESYGYQGRDGGPLSEGYLRGFLRDFRARFRMEMESEHIP
ncbi:DUF2637 domain-containing protein [Streptomyces sp. 769]|uniref:DUF2637 domain-containing protein n=1 Tax=Streptomyces sp. 769 TaxID=1262452 RepID=UPI000581BE38|nr:DUF2637 domain-containing protein [Streptomyces sp. 769]AJC57521.1 hypothetical protein GZL_04944 [Streptomyces sp. 769]